MTKLIDEKKFLADIDKYVNAWTFRRRLSKKKTAELLSKHLKDLPEKMSHAEFARRPGSLDEIKGYNQCLEDCEDK